VEFEQPAHEVVDERQVLLPVAVREELFGDVIALLLEIRQQVPRPDARLNGTVPPPMSSVAVIREGQGPVVLLVHGGASPATTWAGLAHLSRRWTLAFVHRRGFPPSPPADGRQDFDVDAADLVALLDGRSHIVAHSYGGLGALIAATRRPAQVRSLTLLEPALFLPSDDPEVARFRRMGDAVLTHGLETDPATLREFLQISGAPGVDEGPLPDDVASGVRRAHGSRSPGEARPALDVIRDAGIPSLVASGGHTPTLERMCDALATALHAQRLVAPGAGHFVAAAPGFADRLERFLISTD
jgi:pimeloyl-ACP methyl ester carboxylesterase